MTNSDLLTPKEASQYIGVTEGTLSVWRATRRYEIPYIKVGHLVKYRLSDLDEWLESRKKNENGGYNAL